jgi:hypothetical protein
MKSPKISSLEKRRDWSPGFWDRMDALAGEVDVEVPGRLPSSEHRYFLFDQDDESVHGELSRDSRWAE